MISDSFLLMNYKQYFTGATGLGYLMNSYSTTKGLGNPMVTIMQEAGPAEDILIEMPNTFKIIKSSESFKDFFSSFV